MTTEKTEHSPSVFNRKAHFDYIILESFETGLVLAGTEVKSIRAGKANLQDSFARIENGELWMYHMHISPYDQGNRYNMDPIRKRKLLLHRKEIDKLDYKLREKGLTLVPLKLYFTRGMAKIQLGVAKGKNAKDKRDSLKKKESDRDVDRALVIHQRRF
jgi:SsrA-binding protein